MAAAILEYYKIILDIIVAVVIATVLLVIANQNRKQKILTGYTPRPKSEKYTGYILLATGIVIMAISIIELIVLVNSDYYSEAPLGLSAIKMTTNAQSTDIISEQLLGLGFGVPFWLSIFVGAGFKMVSLAIDLVKGTQLKIIKKIGY